jgi:hypothetical protein
MHFIDSHTHLYLRSSEDLELMALAGVEGAVLCSYYPIKPSSPSTLIDLYRWLIEEEPERLSKFGLSTWVAVGVHPRSIPNEGIKKVLDHLLMLFNNKQASALGEVGLEVGGKEEEKILVQQMQIANEYAVPIIIHTPRSNKSKIFNKLLSIIESEKVDHERIIIDHLTPDLVPKARSLGVIAGLTVQPGKLTPKDVADILSKNGPEGIVVNSDLGNVSSDPLALPKVAHYLDQAGFGARDIELVTRSNIRTLLLL